MGFTTKTPRHQGRTRLPTGRALSGQNLLGVSWCLGVLVVNPLQLRFAGHKTVTEPQ